MDDVVSTFPLLHLPIDAISYTFRSMHPGQVFGISILSKKTKILVESLKITTWNSQVHVTDKFEIYLFFPCYSTLHFQFYRIPVNKPPQELGTPENFRIAYDRKEATWTNSLSVKQLLDHLKLVFHSPITTLFFNANCERLSLESVYKNVNEIRSICFLSGNHEHNRKILSMFQPASITLAGSALVNFCIPKDVLLQNFDVIHVPIVRITLDEFLMTNSRVINLVCNRYSSKILNRFLNLWVKGSNPRLEFLSLAFFGDFLNEELLEGLEYKAAPHDRLRLFNNSAEKKIEKVVGGWDILRCDGTKATITVYEGQSVVFQLFVWHDHCIID